MSDTTGPATTASDEEKPKKPVTRKKQRWSRAKYNAYQRELMAKRRKAAKEAKDDPFEW